MKPFESAAELLAAPCLALLFFAACSSNPAASDGLACAPRCGGDGGSDAGVRGETGGGGGSETGVGGDTGSGGGGDTGLGVDTGSGGGVDAGEPGGDADDGHDATGSADVEWGQPCLYNFGSSCPFQNPQECGNHQAIVVTFPNGNQLLNATLFSGLDCSPSALNDNFNDQQTTMPSGIWMFTDDADVAGVSASNPTSAIWWVGALTSSGYPPTGAPTSGCINYTSAMPMCQ
jgi:hypothetical protein